MQASKYGNWFEKNPIANPNIFQKMRFGMHEFGRQTFAGSFARGGLAATLFAPTAKEAFLAPFRGAIDTSVGPGSQLVGSRLRELEKMHPRSASVKKAIKAFEAGPPKGATSIPGKAMGLAGKALGPAMAGYLIFGEAIAMKGSLRETAGARGKAVVRGAASYAAWGAGMKAGAAIGGAAFGLPGAIVGGLVGGVGAAMGADAAVGEILDIPDRMVDKERNRRKLNWGQHTAAFQTDRAHTMRQQSLQMMNRGSMSARTLLGQEAMFVHR